MYLVREALLALQLRQTSGLCMRLLRQMYIRRGLRCAQLQFGLSWSAPFGQGRWQKLQILIVDWRRLELKSERWSDTESRRVQFDEERVEAHGLHRSRCAKGWLQLFRTSHVASGQ